MLADPDPCLLVKLLREAGSPGRRPSGQPWAMSPGFAQTVHSPTFHQLASSLQGLPPRLLSPTALHGGTRQAGLSQVLSLCPVASVISLISLGQHNTHTSTLVGI